jgi:hypothetical protein
MQPKKQPNTKGTQQPRITTKAGAPRRPVGVQSLGPTRYEQLRRALNKLTAAAR